MRDSSNTAGFTLVELLTVITIAAILFSIASMSFNSMSRKAKIEQIARELVADLNSVRSESIFRGKRHSIVINSTATGYVFRRYSSPDEPRTSTAPDPATATNPASGIYMAYGIYIKKSFPYGLTRPTGTSIADRIFEFDRNGFTTDLDTIAVNPFGSGAAFDCVVVSASRTNIGKMGGGTCVQR